MSYHNHTDATYDRTLLSSVPDPTKAEKQEGYNVDLLEESRDRRPPTPPAPTRQPTDQQPLTDGYTPDAPARPHKEGQLENGAAAAKARWYRTRWGITAIVIIIILIIGAIVGGVVGGTHHSSPKKNNFGTGSGNNNGSTGGDGGNSSQSSSISSGGGISPNTPTSPGTSTESVAEGNNNATATATISSTRRPGESTATPTTLQPQQGPNTLNPQASQS